MKISETLHEKGNFDTRKVTNRAANMTIAPATLETIEQDGITSEQLDTLGVPVYKYKTQVTLHGIFPALGAEGRIGNYKMLCRNQNGSLGVKYNAIDHAKKERIYTALKRTGWSIDRDSAGWLAAKLGHYAGTRAEIQGDIDTFKAELAKIDTSLFFGNARIVIIKDMFFGVCAALILEIGAIYEGNVIPFIESATGRNALELEQEIQAEDAARELQYAEDAEKWREQERIQEERRARFQEELDQEMTSAGLIKAELDKPSKGQDFWYIKKVNKDQYNSRSGYIYRVRVVFKQGFNVMSAKSEYPELGAAIECLKRRGVNRATAEKFKVSVHGIGTVWVLGK